MTIGLAGDRRYRDTTCMSSPIVRLTLHRLAIPLRRRFEHAAAARDTADPLLLVIELASGTIGVGETLARPYVTGETPEQVVETVQRMFMPMLSALKPQSFAEALEAASSLTYTDDGDRPIPAARALVELALLDLYSRHFRRPISEAAGWLGLPRWGPPGSLRHVRYSGVLSAKSPAMLRRSLRRMRCFGLRDFKLKVGMDGDDDNVRAAAEGLGSRLRDGRCTLRLDANGAWTLEQAIRHLTAWQDYPISYIEQPLAKGRERDLIELQRHTTVPLMADESLVTFDDAERLITGRATDAFNIRISKNGGFVASMRLAALAQRHEVRCVLGCMVGETSLLSAAGRHFLTLVPDVQFAEGSYGRFLLRDDVFRPRVQLGWAGRARPLSGVGWGAQLDELALRRYACQPPIILQL
jgi:L-alanine-DL-glutamate epimerase-like enolase superfamily enzyme